eukprot:m.237278 g.237278  ORF g.237278 m.237278 type:complete len:102 (+) comp16056_c0_seq2:495-800(+)
MIQVIETLSSEASPKLQSHENDQSVVTSTQAEEVADQTINKNHDDAGSADSAGASAIEAIKSIFPDFGEGFIISCLQELEVPYIPQALSNRMNFFSFTVES